jgi:NitT/TauT family transport system permease protein
VPRLDSPTKSESSPSTSLGFVSAGSTPLREALARCAPKVAAPLIAAAVALLIWEMVVWSGWRPEWVLPGPRPVLARLVQELASGEVVRAAKITLGRALSGFAFAIVVGTALGFAMSKIPLLRAALSGMIAGLQTMPSVAWFPLAILLFQLGEASILFVVVLGAAPSIAVGLLGAIDNVQPLLTRVGRTMGARGITLYRHVIFPAALPSYVAGLKQGWAFSWRSLMAGELMVILADRPSIGARLHFARELSDAEGLLAWMLVVLAIGLVVDLAVFGRLEHRLRANRGLIADEH